MTDREHLIARAGEALALAPFRPAEWLTALRCLAQATGSSHGRLAGWIAPGALPFYLMTDEPEGVMQRWIDIGGIDPARNPIIAGGLKAAVLEILSDTEIISADERRRHPMWGDFYDKVGLPHLCFTTLWRDAAAHLVLTVPRSVGDGPIDDDQRNAFRTLAHMFRSAALVWRSLKNEEAQIAKGALDVVSVAAVILDGFGRVAAVSKAAEEILRECKTVRVRDGRLEGVNGAFAQVEAAVRACFGGCGAAHLTLPDHAGEGGALTLRVAPFRREADEAGFGAVAIVVLERAAQSAVQSASHGLRAELAAVLTPAEREVAAALLGGARPIEIAQRRAVSVETVRSQIKHIYQKAGVSGYMEFVAAADGRAANLSKGAVQRSD